MFITNGTEKKETMPVITHRKLQSPIASVYNDSYNDTATNKYNNDLNGLHGGSNASRRKRNSIKLTKVSNTALTIDIRTSKIILAKLQQI